MRLPGTALLLFVSSALAATLSAATSSSTIHVDAIAGDALASGAALREAYASATEGTGQSPVTITLSAGTYDIGNEPFRLTKSHVTLEGSGRNATILAGSGSYVLLVSADTKVSRLAIENLDGHEGGYALYALDGFVDLRELDVHISRSANSVQGPVSGGVGIGF